MKTKDKRNEKLRVLCLEDDPRDAEIMRALLTNAGFDLGIDCTDKEKEFVSFLRSNTYDIILSDFKLPGFDGFKALRLSMEICPNVPFICVSGTIGEEAAVELLKQGAVDYVLKDRLTRLPVAIRRALDEAKEKESRRRAEEALHESEARNRSILQSATDAIVTVDSSGMIIGWNSAAERTFGYNYTEAVGQPLISIVSFYRLDEHTNRMMEFQSERSQDAIGKTGIYKGYRKDKSEFPIELSLSSWETKSGQFFTGIIRNITDRKQAEEALRESEEKYHNLYRSASLGIFHSTIEGKFIDMNPALARMLGYNSPEEAVECITNISEQVYAEPPLRDAVATGTLKAGGILTVENLYRRRDGSIWSGMLHIRIVTDQHGNTSYYEGFVEDITERKQTEEKLKKSEEKYRSIFENVQDVYYETLFDGTILEVSPSIELMSKEQYHRSDLKGRSMYELYADAKNRDDIISAMQKTGSVTDSEVRLKNRDGSFIFCSISAKIKLDAEGRPEKIIGSMHDITERKRAEEALRESEERFRSLYENSTVGLYRTTPEGKIVSANSTLVKMLGYSSFEELTLRNLEEEGFEPSYKRKHFIEQIESNGEVHGLETAWICRDGSNVYIRESARAVRDSNGKTIYYDGSVENITERKQAENALVYERNLLRSLMDNVPDQIYFKDINSRFLRMSKSQAEKFALSDPAQAIGKTDFDFFTEEHAKPAYEHEQEIIKTGLPLVNIEEKETWPDGKETWVSTTKVPLRDLTGKIIGTFGISRDVTEQKKLQSQLMQTQKFLSIGTLAGGIAHDFNNILGIILAFTSVLERSEGDKEKISKSTTAITQAVSRGAGLVRQILTFARQTSAVVKPVLIPDLVREIVNMLKETFPEVIEFKTTMENNVPFINADHSQMHQVLLNLCVNARDAMPKGGIIGIEVKTVTSETLVRQFPEAKNDRYISISVSDTGIGMDEATRSRIFDPFFTTKEQGKGTGLGLSVVYGIIQDHHGFISVDSTVGQGTTFHLYIPILQEEKKPEEIKYIKVEELQRGSETILFVEDEELLRDIVQSSLESNGYKVLIASHGREAVDIYKKQYKDIALVLSDMGLPKLGGIDVYAILKEINPKIKIIFASGFISLETRSELFKEGVKGIIQKPYSIHEVLQMVREVLDEHREING